MLISDSLLFGQPLPDAHITYCLWGEFSKTFSLLLDPVARGHCHVLWVRFRYRQLICRGQKHVHPFRLSVHRSYIFPLLPPPLMISICCYASHHCTPASQPSLTHPDRSIPFDSFLPMTLSLLSWSLAATMYHQTWQECLFVCLPLSLLTRLE